MGPGDQPAARAASEARYTVRMPFARLCAALPCCVCAVWCVGVADAAGSMAPAGAQATVPGPSSPRAPHADAANAKEPDTLVVGLFDAPPFSEPLAEAQREGLSSAGGDTGGDAGARWTGSSLELLERVAQRLGVRLEYRTGSERDIVSALGRGEVDVCGSPLAPTPDRIRAFDLSHTFAAVGLAAATRSDGSLLGDLRHVADGLLAHSQLRMYLLICACVLFFALVLWALERRRNADFRGHPLHGIGNSLWWSVVTLATVGYGDKVPRTGRGRAVAAIWMLLSLVLTSVFTATIVSALTVGSISAAPIQRTSDLLRVRVAAVADSIAADYLALRDIPFRQVGSFEEGLQLVEANQVDALVGPESMLRATMRGNPRLTVADARFSQEFLSYGLSFSLSADFRRRFDEALVLELPQAASAEAAGGAPDAAVRATQPLVPATAPISPAAPPTNTP